MKVDLEPYRDAVERIPASHVHVDRATLEALVAVVDAAREYVSSTFAEPAAAAEWARQHGRGETGRFAVLVTSLEPFAPPEEGAPVVHGEWEEVDRWNAERDLAVKAAVDAAKPNPRDRARDQLADAGVTVQRQFRADQERIAELERERGEWRGMWQEEIKRALDAVEERDALRKELAEARKERDWARGLVEYQGGERPW